MQNLIHKWKKIINNEKTDQTEDNQSTSVKDVNENSISYSVISERSNKFKNKTKSSRFNSTDENFKRSNSSQSKTKKEEKIISLEPDKAIQLLKKTISVLQKNQDNSSIKLIENLNEVIDLHIESLNNSRLRMKKYEDKEIIWITKCETAEKILRDFELKVLSSDKEKVSL